METFYWDISGDFSDLPTQPTLPTLLSFFFNEKGKVIRDTFLVEVASTNSPRTLLSRNRQVRPLKSDTASLRTPVTNLRSGLYTASPGGGVAHAGGSSRRPNRRPNYACRRNQNETVALFCKVNAKRWCLQAEPTLFWAAKLNTTHYNDLLNLTF